MEIKEAIQQVKQQIQVNQAAHLPLPVHLQNHLESLPTTDKKILAVKYSAPQIKKLFAEAFYTSTSALIFKIHVITGWVIPQDPHNAYVNSLQDQLRKKLLEDYEDYNFDEIEFAFRNYGTAVKDWGKSFNLNLIDTVMNAYIAHRNNVSEYECRITEPKLLGNTPTPEEKVNLTRELIEMRYQDYLDGYSNFIFYPEFGLQQLTDDGFTEPGMWEYFTKSALNYEKTAIAKQIAPLFLNGKRAHAKEMSELSGALKETDDKVISTAKKIALLYCFEQFKKVGAAAIYVKAETKLIDE